MNLVSPIDTRALYADEGVPDAKLLHEFFELQAAVRAAHPAVECAGEIFTYKRLDRMANRIAHWLQERGVGPGAMVGICMEKSCRLYAAILGILKAGGAYVPIDPKFPIDRIKCILEDAAMQIVITSGSELDQVAVGPSITLLALDTGATQVSHQSRRPLSAHQIELRSDDPCYVIYTSGSTGRPKGVVIEHRNAVNFVRALKTTYKLESGDRIYQGFSVAFDASVEEIWAAFALGGTLVVPPDLVARSPFDAHEFISKHGVTFFSTVPTFLSMMDGDLPSVRLLVVGGEECPEELVSRWAPGRRMLNTYGPTETTVVATAAECVAGETVTIGRPLPGYVTRVLNDRLEAVADGEPGELFIAGESVARGYINRPQLNTERFVCDGSLDEQGAELRFFRTHDVVRMTKSGALEFLGRNDQLIKIRGFRVELSEIESILMEYPFVRAAVVNALKHGDTVELAAYIVPEGDLEADDRRRLVELLRRRLPDYMIPRYLDVLEELPIMLSGKVDRKLLPAPQMLLASEDRQAAAPATPMERTIVESFERCFGVSPIYATDDFFRELGGHSHIAGRVATDLRAKLGTNRICVRDFYAHRTARHLALHLEHSKLAEFPKRGKGEIVPDQAAAKEQSVGTSARWTCALVQALVVLALHAAVIAPVLYLLLLAIDVFNGVTEWWRAAQTASTFALFIWPGWLVFGIAVKWIVIGRFKPGRYPLWGSYYLRWWIVDRFQSIGWSAMFIGTPLMSLYYRAMGAKVSRNCTIGTPYCGAFDLLSVGEGTSIGADTHILGYRVEDGHLILGRITIGNDCFVGVHCNLGLNVTIEDRAALDDMSMLPDGGVIARGQSCRGSPAAPGNVKLPAALAGRESRMRRALFGMLHLGLIYVMGYFLLLGMAPGVVFTFYCLRHFGPGAAAVVAIAALPLSGLWWLSIVLLVKWLWIGRIQSGTYRLTSGAYLRIWFLRYLLDNTRHLLNPIYATMFTPHLLRLLGARIGRNAEVSTVMHVMPDLIELGDGSFLADACMVGGPRIYRGWVDVAANKIGPRSFVGNSAFTPSGVELGVNSLVGVMSTPPSDRARTPDGTRWLGSPSFELYESTRPAATGQGDESRTYRPTYGLVLYRGLMELLRMLLPAFILGACLAAFVYLIASCYAAFSTPVVFLIAPVATLALSLALVAASACIKWLLIGTFRPTVRPLWCAYVWRNEIVNGVYETLAANVMSPLLGTPFAAPCLRLMGCKIGRGAFLHTTLFSEFDLVNIGDNAALNLGSTIQTHLFENRMMKADTLEIGERCSIGNMSVVLYGAKMQDGSSLGPMSLLMKGETLPAATRWHGIPTEPVRSPSEGQTQRTGASEVA